jgi:metal-sulfur cluster biosynthetic enzyme
MQPDLSQSLEGLVERCLEAIVDPCSVASGAPAGLVSMGLVGSINVEHGHAGHEVHVTLRITEPGCMMGALFQLTARNEISKLPGVLAARVDMDYAHVWGPEQMSPKYQQRLAALRSARASSHHHGSFKTIPIKGSRANA